MHKKLVLGFAVDALIKPELNLIKSILRTSSVLQGRWHLGKGGPCDAIILNDLFSPTDPFVTKVGTKRIFIKRRGEVAEGYVFFKPIRAEDLVKLLLQIQSGVVESESQSKHWEDMLPGVSYKLRKWPSSDILKQDKRYPKLATYLSRHYKTLDDLCSLSGLSEKICSDFITHLEDSKILLVFSDSGQETISKKQSINKKTKIKKAFIQQLKKRFQFKQSVN